MDLGEPTFILPSLEHRNADIPGQIPYFVARYGFLANLLTL